MVCLTSLLFLFIVMPKRKNQDKNLLPRGVKVRGYDPYAYEWVTGQLAPFTDNETVILVENPQHSSVEIRKVVPNTVTNYTGFKDMEGREIYVGDAVRVEYMGIYYVRASHNSEMELVPLSFKSEGKTFLETKKFVMDFSKADKMPAIEIIGNVIVQNLNAAVTEYLREKQQEKDMAHISKSENNYMEPISLEPEDLLEFDDECDNEDWDQEDWEEDDYLTAQEWEEQIDADEKAMLIQDAKDFIHSPNTGFQKVQEPENVYPFRAKLTDLQTWVYGELSHENYDFDKPLYIYTKEDKDIVVHDILADTVSRATPYKSFDGKYIYSKDIILINKEALMVIDYVPGIGFALIKWNLYDTEYSNDPSHWGHIRHEAWQQHPEVLEIAGNTIDGISEDYVNLLKDLSKKKSINGWHETEDNVVTELESQENEDSNNPIKSLARYIDGMVYNMNKKITGFYIDDYSSDYSDMILQCRWKLNDGYEIHAFYNSSNAENAVFFGKYELNENYDLTHGLISYSVDKMSAMIDTLTHIMMDEVDKNNLVLQTVNELANLDYWCCHFKKSIDYDDIFEHVFNSEDAISHTQFEKKMKALFKKNNLYRFECRAMSTTGQWRHGAIMPVYEDGEEAGYKLKTIYRDKLWNQGTITEHVDYLVSTVGYNSFLVDKNYKFIYSGDIVDFEGIGRLVVYITDDIDPSDLMNPAKNEYGQKFIYYMPYEKFMGDFERCKQRNEILTDAKEKGEEVSDKNIKNNIGFVWRPVKISDWLRNRKKITVVGNMMETMLMDKSVCFNSEDFDHDSDPLPTIFKINNIYNVSEKADNKFWKQFLDSTTREEDDIAEFLYNFADLGIGSENCMWNVYHMSDDTKTPIKTVDIKRGNIIIRCMWKTQFFITVMVGTIDNDHVNDIGVIKYAETFNEAVELIRDILTGKIETLQSMYNFQFTMPDLKATKKYEVNRDVMRECDGSGVLVVRFGNDMKKYLRFVLNEYFMGNSEEMRKVEARAMNEYGRWMIGCLSPDGRMFWPGGEETYAEHYIRESLGFNTYIIDASKKFIYDNDIIMHHGECTNVFFIIERESFVGSVYDLAELCIKRGRNKGANNRKKINEVIGSDLLRCMYNPWKEAFEETNLCDVSFVKCDIDWLLRNMKRILVIGDSMTNNIEIDEFDM